MIKIMIDAGHYGKRNQSPVVPEYYESEMTWKLHNFLVEALSNYEGIETATTREEQNKDLNLYKRGKKAKGYDIFISLHSNAFKEDDVDRVDIYYPLDGRNNAKELAEKLVEAISELMGVSKGEAKTKESTKVNGADYYAVMYGAQKANCPMYLLIEHSFHTNKKAAEWLLNDENLQALAELEAEIIAEWYGLKPRFLLGDVNGNGKIDSMDYILAKRIYFGTYKPTEEELKRCDIDGDGKVSAMDYILIKRMYFGTYKPKGE
ncbi:MAG: N-acetylmuramoyl-L-alanine amidase [Clostridia bacterium]|nr:N-acetylmuramoyl-L-alanine amidase [Clostridia bacterium]